MGVLVTAVGSFRMVVRKVLASETLPAKGFVDVSHDSAEAVGPIGPTFLSSPAVILDTEH